MYNNKNVEILLKFKLVKMITLQIIIKFIAYFIIGRLIIELLDAKGIINLVKNQLLREFEIIICSIFAPVVIVY